MTIQITVLGLGQVGASIGLALAERKDLFVRIGNDLDPQVARAAARMKAFDEVPINLPASVEKAGVVVLALPVDEIRKTLEVIAPDLKPGTVVIDTSPVKAAVMAWAQELIPAGRFFISMTPTFNPKYLENLTWGVEAAHADLFAGGLMVITHPPGIDEQAIKLAVDLAGLLGAAPLFADPLESDGLLAGSHLLPKLLAAALVNALADQPGWDEGRKLAGKSFAAISAPLLELDERLALGQAALLNRQNALRVLDNLAIELETLRQALADEDSEKLAARLEQARQQRAAWLKLRHRPNLDDRLLNGPTLPTPGEFFAQMIGMGKKKNK